MLERYNVLTVTHRHTNLKEIARFVLPCEATDDLQQRLTQLRTGMGLDELFYVATCNRVLFLFTTDEQHLSDTFVRRFFQVANPDLEVGAYLENDIQHLQGEAAVRHMYDVAASMDSLVIGERQILGQLKESYDRCRKWRLIGDDIRLLFDRTVLAARDVYANTKIGDKSVSVVSLAVQKLLRLKVARSARVLLIGAGQTNALAAKFLKKHQYEHVVVANRTVERAEKIAETFDQGRAISLEELSTYDGGFDVLIVCTGSNKPILTETLFRQLVAGEPVKGKIVIDLAVPHNVEGAVASRSDIHYVEIEHIRTLARENLTFRAQEMKRAEALLGVHLEEFPILYRQRQLEIALRQVPTEIKAVKAKAINEVFRKEVEGLDEHTRDLMDRMLTYMEKKCIGIPMKAAREALIG